MGGETNVGRMGWKIWGKRQKRVMGMNRVEKKKKKHERKVNYRRNDERKENEKSVLLRPSRKEKFRKPFTHSFFRSLFLYFLQFPFTSLLPSLRYLIFPFSILSLSSLSLPHSFFPSSLSLKVTKYTEEEKRERTMEKVKRNKDRKKNDERKEK